MIEGPAPDISATQEELLRSFLALYWLRPETALLLTMRSSVLSAAGLDTLRGDAVDLASGDGIFPFIHFGGRIDPEFDLLMPPQNAEKKDLYNSFSETYVPKLIVKPTVTYRHGVDHAPNLLKRAACLGLYENQHVVDLTTPLPLESESADTLSCFAAIDHLPDDTVFLSEAFRVLRPGGTLMLVVHTPNMIAQYVELEKRFPQQWVHRIERGMRGIWPSLLSWQEWEQRLTIAGFETDTVSAIGTDNYARMWNFGFRPLAAPLATMKELARKQDAEAFLRLKMEWIEVLYELALPFLGSGSTPDDATEVLFVLKKPQVT